MMKGRVHNSTMESPFLSPSVVTNPFQITGFEDLTANGDFVNKGSLFVKTCLMRSRSGMVILGSQTNHHK